MAVHAGLVLRIAFVYVVIPFHTTALLTGGNARSEALPVHHESRFVPTHSSKKLPGVVASHFQLRSVAAAEHGGKTRSSLHKDRGDGDDEQLALTPREKSAIEDVVGGDYDKVDLPPPKQIEFEAPPPVQSWPTFVVHEFRRLYKETLPLSILGFFVSMLLVSIFAFFYARWKQDLSVSEDERSRMRAEFVDGHFRHGLFQCMEDPRMSIFACICMPIRWGDTMRMGGMIPFWSATMMFAMFTAMWSITCGLSLIVTIAMATMRRQEIRSLFGMTHGTAMSRAEDCCTYMWCSCCAVVQEARQLEAAYAAQHAGLYGKVPHLVLRNK